MTSVLVVASVYLLAGVIAIALLDSLTGRVRRRIGLAAHDTQTAVGGGRVIAVIVTVFVLWLFWPLAIYAALFQR